MANNDLIVLKGIVVDAHQGGKFSVKDEKNNIVMCHIGGPIRKREKNGKNETIVVGDIVEISVSTYDLTKGRITRNLKSETFKAYNKGQ